MQDDAILCDRFPERAVASIEERPGRLIALFVPGLSHFARASQIARRRGEAWMDIPGGLIPLVAVVYPAAVARGIPDYCDRRRMGHRRADDAIVGQYGRAHRLLACAPLPNLVDHRDEVPSAMRVKHGTGAAHRVSVWFHMETT